MYAVAVHFPVTKTNIWLELCCAEALGEKRKGKERRLQFGAETLGSGAGDVEFLATVSVNA